MNIQKYLLAILPPEPILADVLKIKEYFRDVYNSKGALNAPAHITLHMPFEWRSDREEILINKLQAFSAEQSRFEIALEGFNCFPPRVIFVNVEDNPNLTNCQRQLFTFCKTQLNIFNATYKEQPFHPHITVAFRDLKKREFDASWQEFKEKPFRAEFKCSSIALLRHDGKFWRQHAVLSFGH
jgi:2'-5' RNA ligase